MNLAKLRQIHDALDEGGIGVARTLARLATAREKLRAEGKLYGAGYRPPHGDGVQRIWRAHGWRPSKWAWDHGAYGWRPMKDWQDGGVDAPAQMPPGELVPLVDAKHRRSR